MNATGPAIGAAAFLALTQAFSAVAPVTIWMGMQGQALDSGILAGRVTGYKIKDCTVIPDTFIGWQRVGRVWRETPFQFVDDPSPNSTRPNVWSKQDFGVWEWNGVDPSATDVKLTLLHDCRGSLTVTQSGFAIKSK